MKKLIDELFNPNNEFFLLTKDAKRLTHISLSSFILPVIFLISAGAIAQLAIAPLIKGVSGETAPWIREVFGLFVVFGLGIVLIFLWVRFFEGRKIYTLGFTGNGALKYYLSGFGLGMLMVTIAVGIIALFGNIEFIQDSPNTTGTDSLWIVLLFLVGFLVQGASEEILSRGWMMQVIGARYKPWLGVLISSMLFAVLHLGNQGVTVLSVANLVLFALFMAMLVMKDSNLWSVCGWHSAWNWMLGNVYGLSVSGTGEKVTIIDLNTYGNEIISGGGFGPEGSVITSIILVIGIIWLAILVKRSNKTPNDQNEVYTDLLS